MDGWMDGQVMLSIFFSFVRNFSHPKFSHPFFFENHAQARGTSTKHSQRCRGAALP